MDRIYFFKLNLLNCSREGRGSLAPGLPTAYVKISDVWAGKRDPFTCRHLRAQNIR